MVTQIDNSLITFAYKPVEELTSQEADLLMEEWAKCVLDFYSFLKWCKIVEAPIPGETTGGVIPFQLLPHNKTIIEAFLTKKLISILKPRQIWVSTTVATYVLWYAQSRVGANILLFSEAEDEAFVLLAKARRVYDKLPPFMQFKLNPDSRGEMGFPSMTSSIKAFPSTMTAGIGETASIVVSDEHSTHPYANENYMSSKPTRDAGGQYISIFTANPWEPENLATLIFEDARAGKNGFTWLFFPWHVIPGRDEKWYEETKRDIPQREAAKMSPELYMQKNYPATIQEALGRAQTISAFDLKVLDEMMGDVRNPVKIDAPDVNPEVVKIYYPFHIGEFYIAGTDTSHGMGKDFSVTTIMNVKTGVVVADIMSNVLAPNELAIHSVAMLKLYHNPLWYIESNDWGGATITAAEKLGYKNFGYQDEKNTKIGFHTGGWGKKGSPIKGTRTDLFAVLMAHINNHQITIPNVKGLGQFYDIIRNAEKNGRIEPLPGKHDDYTVAVGICLAKKDEVKIETFVGKPIETLHFRPRHGRIF